MKKIIYLFIFLPVILQAQELLFELQPEAFPVELNGWQMYSPWAGGINYSTPKLCDLDNDLDLDFYCGDERGYVNYFKNIGNPVQPCFEYVTCFLDSLQYPLAISGYGHSDIDFADMDGDGDKDAILGAGYVLIYPNIGNSSQSNFYSEPDTLRDSGSNYVLGPRIAVTDIDADGDNDLFSGVSNGNIRFYENIGSSNNYLFSLTNSNWFNIQVSGGYAHPGFADLDGDDDLDLLVGTGQGKIYYYRNDGNPQVPQLTYVTDNFCSIDVGEDASPELADIDTDGDLDLFVGRSMSSALYFQQGDVFFLENNGTPQSPDFQIVTTNYLVFDSGDNTTPNFIDIDADGDPDLFSGKGDNLLFYRNTGTLNEPAFVFESENFGGISVTAIMPWFVDIDADGDYDLLAGEQAIPGPPGVNLFTNTGTAQIPEFFLTSNDLVPGVFQQSSGLLFPVTIDIDDDCDQDLFVSDMSGGIYLFENIGSSANYQFQFQTDNWQNLDTGIVGTRKFCFYDIDNDNDYDLFINIEAMYNQPWEKNLMFYRNTGTSQSANMVLEIDDMFPELMIWQAGPYLLDIDQDGDGDLFVGDAWGGIRFFRNMEYNSANGEQRKQPYTFTLHQNYPNPFNASTTIRYELGTAGFVSLNIFDITGRAVGALHATPLQNRWMPSGYHEIVWDASGVASGVYLVKLGSGDEVYGVKKLVLIK